LAGRLKRLFQKVICLHHDLIFVMDLQNTIEQANCLVSADFVEIFYSDIPRLEQAMKNADEYHPCLVEQRFHGSDLAWAVIVDGHIVHYDFVTFGSRWLDIVEQDFPLKNKEAFIYNCHTLRDWRGRGLFTCSLVEILRHLSSLGLMRCYIDVDARNKPSLKAIYRAGFELYQSRYMIRIFGKPVFNKLIWKNK
jgi:RimJ/RimL family protein N-acetyltransferase